MSHVASVSRTLGLAGLYLLGLLNLAVLLEAPAGPSANAGDWAKEYRYYAVLQQALRDGRAPDYVSRPILETRKFLAIPEVSWSPQVLALRWVPVPAFVGLNTALLFTAGFAGSLLLASRHRLPFVSWALLASLLLANGHLTAHLAVGHSMWAGAFLLPFFFLVLLELPGERPAGDRPFLLGVVAFAVLLQGAYHVYVWMLLLLTLTAVFTPALRRPALAAVVWALGLGLCRLAPAALVLGEKRGVFFLSGYPTIHDLAAGLVALRDAATPKRGGFVELGWWEYDAYVGPAGAAWLAWFGLRGAVGRGLWGLGGAAVVMTVLSVGYTYLPVTALEIPLFGSQRVSSRLLLIPLCLLVVAAARRTAETERTLSPAGRWLLGAWLAAVLAGLAMHTWVWRVSAVERGWPAPRERDLAIRIEETLPDGSRDRTYELTTRVAGCASVGLLALGVGRMHRRRPGS